MSDLRPPTSDAQSPTVVSSSKASAQRIAIVGGGLAGLAAAAALAGRGLEIELFEAKRRLGGRAGSYFDRESGEWIDHCQHVAMGCCTNYQGFCRRTGIENLFQRYRTLTFIGPDGRRSQFAPSLWLPPPLHLTPALLGLSYLSLREKLAIARAMWRLVRTPPDDDASSPTVLAWLEGQRHPPRANERFCQVVLDSALGESLERASLAAARKVFIDVFLAHRQASDLLVPCVSLTELYDRRVADWLRARGVTIHLEAAVEQIAGDAQRVTGVRLAEGNEQQFDAVILAPPWRRAADVIGPKLCERLPLLEQARSLPSAPISAVHLWLDKPITDLAHAALVGRLSQWVFRRSERAYYQVVISASHDLAGRDRQSVIDEVLADLRAVFPAAARAQLVRSKLIAESDAVFSVQPGIDERRPPTQTDISNLLLAGDWTRTGWPATMEGAVRSGYLAAERVLALAGQPSQMVTPDLSRGWLVKALGLGTRAAKSLHYPIHETKTSAHSP
jgi:squalene-associated FAD-dependent desaturase